MMTQTLTIPQALQLAQHYHQSGELHQARTLYQHVLQLQPQNSEVLHGLGVLAIQAQNYPEAIHWLQQAIALNDTIASFHINLGNGFYYLAQYQQAIHCFQRALTLEPDNAQTYNNLGNVYWALDEFEQAQQCYQQALALAPDYVEAHYNLGVALTYQRQFAEAVPYYQKALALDPQHVDAYINLGHALQFQDKVSEAIQYFKHALTLKPDVAEVYGRLGHAFVRKGLIDEAIEHYRQAVILKPSYRLAHSNLLLTLNYSEAYDPKALLAEHRRFDQLHVAPLKKHIQAHLNERTPQRRLKLGYISPNFSKNSVAFFSEPLLAHHDHQHFELFCYHTDKFVDNVTQRLRGYADCWRHCVDISDADFAEQIRHDQIDILVNLTLPGLYELVLARKPAPIQVTYLGYPTTTGVSTIDYRLSDAYVDPIGSSEAFNSETVIRTPDSYFCYRPYDNAPEVKPLPALTQGYITFGSFNNYSKLNDKTFALWAHIITQVPGAKLLIKAKALQDPPTRQEFINRMHQLGIAAQRLVIADYTRSTEEHLQLYHQVDICLDSYPYNGATTTCEASWMGVPVVTLVGATHVARMGLSLLSSLGLTDFIAYTPEDYVRINVHYAHQWEALHRLRHTMRARMQAASIMQPETFTRNVEALYRQIWTQWCA